MKPSPEENCCRYGSDNSSGNSCNFELQKGTSTNRGVNHRPALSSLSKLAPSKWDDAQKWLSGVSNGVDQGHSRTIKPRKSNADERKYGIQTGRNSGEVTNDCVQIQVSNSDEGETKKIDCEVSFCVINNTSEDTLPIQSICLRDTGTEMTPNGSKEPSRTATPLRAAATTALRNASRMSTPSRHNQGVQATESDPVAQTTIDGTMSAVVPGRYSFQGTEWGGKDQDESEDSNILRKNNSERDQRASMLETRAMAWDEAEKAKYMARYKREEVKIQAWENRQKRRAEAEMRRIEVKAERMKTKAKERVANKLAVTQRKADEKRANANVKMNEQAVKTSEKSEYIRRTGHLPTSFLFFKFPSFCWSN